VISTGGFPRAQEFEIRADLGSTFFVQVNPAKVSLKKKEKIAQVSGSKLLPLLASFDKTSMPGLKFLLRIQC